MNEVRLHSFMGKCGINVVEHLLHIYYLGKPSMTEPLSDLTRDGKPYVSTALLNAAKTVSDLLFDATRYTGICEKPSIPHLMKNKAHTVK